VLPWSEVECLAGQLGRGGGIGGTEDAGRLERCHDRDLIARLCAGDELGGHHDRKRAAGQQHLRHAPVDGTPDRGRQAAADGLAENVVPEHQLAAVVGEDLGLEEFVDGADQLRDRQIGHCGQVVNAEPAAES